MNALTKTMMLAAMMLTAPIQTALAGSELTSRITGDGGRYSVTDLGRGRIHLEGYGHDQWIEVFRTGQSTLGVFGSGSGTTGTVFDNSIGGDNRVVFGMCAGGRTKNPIHLDRSYGLVIADCE
ncbi:MAG: hypothetical protein NXH88_01670 [Hyphomonas sp.]|nr:hypothetical protein [Hyphomonas sp.]